jgi:glycosyltransferase involved in cell wall biosynthesis
MRVVVCHPQVPFDRGGAEILSETLVEQLRERGHEAELVTVPFKWYPPDRVLTNALAWRLLDLEEAQGRRIDLVIATKFPSYAVRHPNKVVWLVHQFRQAYDLDRTEFGELGEEPFDRALRRSIHRLDERTLAEARRLFAISRNVANRLLHFNGLHADVLTPPPQRLDYRLVEYGDFILSVGRLDRAKRIDLLVRAAAAANGLRFVVAGEGPDRERLEELARAEGLGARMTFPGRVGEQALADLYARCLAVYYAPKDEDFGYVPYEAFLSEKPVITTRDAGGPLEVVQDGLNGIVCEPTPSAVAEACTWLAGHQEAARTRGRAGKELTEGLTWDSVVESLLGT